MTTGQATLIGLCAAGAALFGAGRHFALRLARGEEAFLPASLVSWRGAASYALTLLSWSGAALSAAALLLLLSGA